MTNIFHVDWEGLLSPTVALLEIVIRGTFMYWALFLMLRFIMKREAGSVSIADLLVIVILADASQNAMAGGYQSLTEGFVLVATIVFWNYALDWLGYHFPAIERFANPKALLLVKDGKFIQENLRRELLSKGELMGKLREKGITEISEIKEAYMEGDGQISVIPGKD